MTFGGPFKDVFQLLNEMPRIPRRELRCHPSVVTALQNYTPDGEYTAYDHLLTRLTGVPVYAKPDMEPGAWELYEDGELAKSGNISPAGA